MITKNEWKEFTEMLKLEEKAQGILLSIRMAEHWKKIDKQNYLAQKRAKLLGIYYHPVFEPFYQIPMASYPRTIEGCIDWVIAGKPVFIKKVKVKNLCKQEEQKHT